jgi:hypothetical protein
MIFALIRIPALGMEASVVLHVLNATGNASLQVHRDLEFVGDRMTAPSDEIEIGDCANGSLCAGDTPPLTGRQLDRPPADGSELNIMIYYM